MNWISAMLWTARNPTKVRLARALETFRPPLYLGVMWAPSDVPELDPLNVAICPRCHEKGAHAPVDVALRSHEQVLTCRRERHASEPFEVAMDSRAYASARSSAELTRRARPLAS